MRLRLRGVKQPFEVVLAGETVVVESEGITTILNLGEFTTRPSWGSTVVAHHRFGAGKSLFKRLVAYDRDEVVLSEYYSNR